jgi:hypothetical protein
MVSSQEVIGNLMVLLHSFVSPWHIELTPTCVVIPNNANMRWIIRAPTRAELEQLRSRIIACFKYVTVFHLPVVILTENLIMLQRCCDGDGM